MCPASSAHVHPSPGPADLALLNIPIWAIDTAAEKPSIFAIIPHLRMRNSSASWILCSLFSYKHIRNDANHLFLFL